MLYIYCVILFLPIFAICYLYIDFGSASTATKCIHDLENIYLGEKLGQLQSDNSERTKENVYKPRKREIELSDHIQFLITEKSGPKKSSVDERDQADESDVEITGGKALNNLFSFIISVL